jgi:hypothetical protein
MEIPERTLIGLKLILEEFGITVATPMMVKSEPPNMAMVNAVIALMQLIHPMGYDFKLVHDEAGFRVVSDDLEKHIGTLRKKLSRGDFILTGRRYGISKSCASKMATIMKYVRSPEQVPFSQQEWLVLVGLWAALHQCTDDKTVVEIVMSDYIEFLPYIDWAEEAVTLIQSQSTRNIQ